jgi:hypothetical protein
MTSLRLKKECELCGSKYKVCRDEKSGSLLCKRCLYWQLFQDLVNKGDKSSVNISIQLDCCYPNSVDKQKDLFIAIIEALDEADRDYAISEDVLVRLAEKWRVERIICEEIFKAFTQNSSILLKKTKDKQTIPNERVLHTD